MTVPIIQVKNLKYRYPNSKRWAINDVSFNIEPNQWVTLIGLNGSGKSTLVKLLDGLLTKVHGQIVVNQLPLNAKSILQIRSEIGIVFQSPKDQFVGATVKDEVAFGLENLQISADQIKSLIKWSLSMVGMTSYRNSLVDNLSGGQQQRIAIADVIALKPKILVLDECTSMLNPQAKIQIMRLIMKLQKQLHLTVLDITHDIDETRYAQKLMVMDNGQLIMNSSPAQVFNHEGQLKALHLGLPKVDVLRDRLRNYGLRIPLRHFSETEMLTWLHKLFLNI